MDKVFKIAFIFCFCSCGLLSLVYAFTILWTAIATPLFAPPMPYCDEIDTSNPRPVGYRYYCKGREKKNVSKIKPQGIIRNRILFEFGE
ncbi:MAG: hypothetical protein LUH11_04165 [Candidatus Gastranaerophilales bacterium]|nr:hypothetical protein [Candidatus Gastranaerophilales bacterium]